MQTTDAQTRAFEFPIRARKWTTIARHFSLIPRKIDVTMWSPRRCKWRRIGLLPGYGRFRKDRSFWLFLCILQIRSPESRTCIVKYPRKRK